MEITGAEKRAVYFFLFAISVVFFVEIGFMDYSLMKTPFFIQLIYDKVTLPSPLLFITHWKGLFVLLMYLISCIPAILLMSITGLFMRRAAGK